jgi:hypothetical protein
VRENVGIEVIIDCRAVEPKIHVHWAKFSDISAASEKQMGFAEVLKKSTKNHSKNTKSATKSSQKNPNSTLAKHLNETTQPVPQQSANVLTQPIFKCSKCNQCSIEVADFPRLHKRYLADRIK